MLKDSEWASRLIAAEALSRSGVVNASLNVTLKGADGAKTGATVAFLALNVIAITGDEEKPGLDRINKFNPRDPNRDARYNEYAPRLLQQVKDAARQILRL